MEKFLAFDIETAKHAPDDRSESFKLGITCAATYGGDTEALWHGPEVDGRYTDTMPVDQVRELAAYLMLVAADGYTIASINGTGFDFRVIAEESEDQLVWENMRDLVGRHYDPTFQMVCQRGFPVGMEAMAAGFLLEGKTEGMDGLKAVEMWKGDKEQQATVLNYVMQDAITTYQICEEIRKSNSIKWVSRAGNHSMQPGFPILVGECVNAPVPDTSWMTGPGWYRSYFDGWLMERRDDKE